MRSQRPSRIDRASQRAIRKGESTVNEQKPQITHRVAPALVALGLAAIVCLALLAGSLLSAPARAAGPAPTGTGADHAITVSGAGETRQAPDMAYLNFQIHTPGATSDAALTAYDAAASALTAKLHELGLADKDIVVNPASTWPDQPLPVDGPPVAAGDKGGYSANGNITVTVRDLSKLHDIAMSGLKSAAGVGLAGVQYALQNDKAARDEAMTKAIDNARAQADTAAAKLNLKVKEVVSVTVQPNFNGPGPWMGAGKGAAESAVGAAAGGNFADLGSRPDIVVAMTVQVSYNFE
jgi:uncharacterized protein